MIEELDFAQASEEDRRGLYEVVAAWAVESAPGRKKPPYEACVARWEERDELGFEPPRFVVAREDGKIIGYAQEQISEAEANAHLANATIVVLAQHRRHGVGTALLRAMRSLLSGRTVIESWSVVKGRPGEQFAAARGFRVITSMTRQRLLLTEPPDIGAVPAGYELVTWKGAAPEQFVGAYVGAPTVAEQLHTVVLPAHRGKGLGRLIKARMLHNLTGVEEIYTRINSDNEHMRRVNHSLGYEDRYAFMAVQKKIADLQP